MCVSPGFEHIAKETSTVERKAALLDLAKLGLELAEAIGDMQAHPTDQAKYWLVAREKARAYIEKAGNL